MAIGGVVLQFRADADKARKDITKLTRTLDGVDDAAGRQNKGLSKFAKIGLAGLAAGATAGIFGLVKMGSAAVTAAADFEQSQNILQANLGATGTQMQKLSDLAKQLGMNTSFSAQDASLAMVELAKAGLSASQIMDGAVAASMALAATEGMDLATASVYMANAMAAFGIKAKGASKVADILAAGSAASTASVEGLAQGLKYVGSTAAAVDVSILDTVTALSALNNVGLDASTAGTSLNRFLIGLSTQTPKAAAQMKLLGLSFTDAKGELLAMPDLIARLQEGLAGLSSTEQAGALKTLFGVEGARAAQALLTLGTAGWGQLREQVDQTGVAGEMAAARMKGFWGALETAKGAIETLAISVGEKLLPVLTGWLTDFTAFLESPQGRVWVDKLVTMVGEMATGVQEWVEGTLVPAIQNVYDWLGSQEGQDSIRGMADSMKTVADAINAVAAALQFLKKVWDAGAGVFKAIARFFDVTVPNLGADLGLRDRPNTGSGGGGYFGPKPGDSGPTARSGGVTVKVEPGYYSTAEKVRVTKTRVYGGTAVL